MRAVAVTFEATQRVAEVVRRASLPVVVAEQFRERVDRVVVRSAAIAAAVVVAVDGVRVARPHRDREGPDEDNH